MKLSYCICILLLKFQLSYVLVKVYTPIPHHSHSAILIGNKLFILDGDANNTSTDLSNIVGAFKQSRAAASASSPNKNIIFLVGGAFGNSNYGIPLIYIFDTVKNVWNIPTIQGIQPPTLIHFDNRLDILDTIRLTWSKESQLQASILRDRYSVTLLPNSIIAYIGKFDTSSGPMNLKEV
ncbi:2421_t:CDS:2, partial [Dentiscutata heterogama]